MKWRVTGAGIGACLLTMMGMSGCAAEDPPEKKVADRLRTAVAALTGDPHRADVEVEVYASTVRIPLFKMSAEMRGTHRSAPEQRATDLDLNSVTTTIERDYGDDLVNKGAVRVITVGDRLYARNTLQSEQWRTPAEGPRVVGKKGYDPASTANMIETTLIGQMFLDSWLYGSSPKSTAAAGGERMSVYSIVCEVAKCLEDSPEAHRKALSAYPGDAIFNAELWVDGQDRPRRLTMTSEFVTGERKMGLSVKFEASLTFHDLGKPQTVTPPVN
ncbi:hypothetical protein [Spirillospora sp. NPDC048819]|uniref:hypothetical protein n=1 Tax=Spirillospora sp. NPDC048819 TaxID=3155268 RepID=UPI0033DA0A32